MYIRIFSNLVKILFSQESGLQNICNLMNNLDLYYYNTDWDPYLSGRTDRKFEIKK